MRGALSSEGLSHVLSVAVAPSTSAAGMFVECRLELWAESIEPSSTCAQLQCVHILTIAYGMPGCGAQAGGWNSRISSREPIHTQTKPPASRAGYAFCFFANLCAAPGASEGMSRTLPSMSNFQPWYRQ